MRAVFRAWCGVEAAGGDAAVFGVRGVRSGGVHSVRRDRKVSMEPQKFSRAELETGSK